MKQYRVMLALNGDEMFGVVVFALSLEDAVEVGEMLFVNKGIQFEDGKPDDQIGVVATEING